MLHPLPVGLEPVSKEYISSLPTLELNSELVQQIRAAEPTTDEPGVIENVDIQDIHVPLKTARDGVLELSIVKPIDAKDQILPAVFFMYVMETIRPSTKVYVTVNAM